MRCCVSCLFWSASIVLGSTTGNTAWPLAALGVTVGLGLLRWVFTTYRIDDENVALRTGVLRRRSISVPRNRIRSVQTDSRLLHRLLGLTVLQVGTGHESRGQAMFALDAVEAAQVPQLRAMLLAESVSPEKTEQTTGRELARWRPSWLRYAPLSFSGLVMIAAAVGLAYQSGFGVRISERVAKAGAEAAHRTGVVVVVSVGVVGVVVTSLLLAVLWSWLTYGNLVLRRDAGVLHLRHGVLRVREHTFDMRRLRGGTLREPLPVRALRGARLDAVMTGVHGEGESSVLLPPCPAGTATAVLVDLIDNPAAVNGPLRGHGAAAARRRWTRALALPALAAVALVVANVIVATSTLDVGDLGRAYRLVRSAGGRPGGLARPSCRRRLAGGAHRQPGASPRLHRLRGDHRVDRASDAAAAAGWGRHFDRGHRGRPQALPGDRRARRAGVVGGRRGVAVGRGQHLGTSIELWHICECDYRRGPHRRVRARLRGRGGVLPRCTGPASALAAVCDGRRRDPRRHGRAGV